MFSNPLHRQTAASPAFSINQGPSLHNLKHHTIVQQPYNLLILIVPLPQLRSSRHIPIKHSPPLLER
jgi:hypothetical protein